MSRLGIDRGSVVSFDGSKFIRQLAKRLVSEFEFAAEAGTPGLVGAAKEHPAREQLGKLMTEGVAVGGGIVVDSYGGVSKQQDIVVYEKLCPVFTHNETVKRLRRHAVATNDAFNLGETVNFRNYTQVMCASGTKEEEFDQEKKSLHQVFAFVLCERFGALPQTMLRNAANFYRDGGLLLGPNFLASLNDGFILPYNSAKGSITRSPMEADGIMFCDQPKDTFARLLSMIRFYVRAGKTVDAKYFERYFYPPDGKKPELRIAASEAFTP